MSFSVFAAFEPVRDLWAALARVADPAPLQSLTWLETWWETVGRERHEEMRLVVASDAAGPFAVFPFVLGRYHTVRYVEWMGDADQPWRGPLVGGPAAGHLSGRTALALLDGATAALDVAIDAMLLRDMPERIGATTNPFVGREAMATGSGHRSFDLVGAATIGDGQGRRLRRQLERLGQVTFEVAASREERAYLFSIFAEQTSAAGEAEHGADPLGGARLAFCHRLAMTDPAETIDGAGTVLAGLFVDERPAAVVLAATMTDVAVTVGVSRSLDGDIGRLSPGRLAGALAGDWFARHGYARLDMPAIGGTGGGVFVPHGHLFRQRTTLGFLLCSGERTLARVKAGHREPVRQGRTGATVDTGRQHAA